MHFVRTYFIWTLTSRFFSITQSLQVSLCFPREMMYISDEFLNYAWLCFDIRILLVTTIV